MGLLRGLLELGLAFPSLALGGLEGLGGQGALEGLEGGDLEYVHGEKERQRILLRVGEVGFGLDLL